MFLFTIRLCANMLINLYSSTEKIVVQLNLIFVILFYYVRQNHLKFMFMKNFGYALRISKQIKNIIYIYVLIAVTFIIDLILWIIIMMIIKYILVSINQIIFSFIIVIYLIAVMNYRYAQNLKKITCEEFVPLFNEQQPHLKWGDVQVGE